MSQRIVIVGAGNTGCELAERLAVRHQVILVDKRAESLQRYGNPLETSGQEPLAAGPRGIVAVVGDGTSRLVLKTLLDPDFHCALVAVAGNDDVNLEVGRLGRSFGFDPVVAIQHHSEQEERYREEHITALDRSRLLADYVERSLRHQGAVVPAGIGLGKGELVEIRLVRTSPVIDRPLKNLAPYRWRVAAVFRQDELIVPTGETTLQVDDRVLLVGDCKILPTVAEYLRLGTPQFPRPFGPNVVTLELGGPDEALHAEADGLACRSGAAHLVRGTPGGVDEAPPQEEEPLAAPLCQGRVERASFALPRPTEPDFEQKISMQRPGVLVLRPSARRLSSRLLGLRGKDAEICDRFEVPVLFARGSWPYEKILLPVSESELNIRSAETAIDLTRQIGASLTAVNVDLPRYISGLPDEVIHQEVVPIRRLCELYEVPLDYHHHEGNPVQHLLAEASEHDLVIMARRRGRRDNYFDPDVALRIARAAACSVLVLTVWPQE
ncbi:MAG: NAD-binding protein [Deltaproteobacteria bacterium]|nr:NAD-binding protein [Deltaproteobacteria bacterium]